MTVVTSLAPLLERFFLQRLMQERRVSPHTIASYRDTFRLLLTFIQQRLHKSPSALVFEEIDAPLIVAFLDHLEKTRALSVRSRNLRLTAIRSFFRYIAFELPTHEAQIQRVLAIPSKRFTRNLVRFLTRAEVDALLAAPDRGTWFGRRDHAFILMAVQTGLRVSEITGVTREDLVLGPGAHVRVVGKGRMPDAVWGDVPFGEAGMRLGRTSDSELQALVDVVAVIACPSRLGSSGASAVSPGLRRSQARASRAVDGHNGIARCFRPLPCKCTQAEAASTTSATRTPMISETRAPVL
jgi:integrase